MSNMSSPKQPRRDDCGMAMLAAVVCMMVIVALTAVAVQQSVGSLSGFGQGRKLLQTVDAAETGLEAEISSVQHWLSSPTGTLPCNGGSSVTGLPTGGWVPANRNSADSVLNAASLGYYSLSMAAYPTQPSGPPSALPSADACHNNSIAAPSGASWYLIVQAKGVTSATTGGTTATGRTLQALLLVHNNSGTLSAFHPPGSHGHARNRVVLLGYYSSGSTTYTSNASAQAISFNTLATTASVASYSGSGSPDPNVVTSSQPPTSVFNGESWLTAGVLAQYAEADSSGSSKSCAGVVASPGTIQVGTANPSCSVSGSPSSTGVKLDLSTIPGLGTVLSSIADVTLETSALTSSASMAAGGSPASGTASIASLNVKVTLPLGLSQTLPVTVPTGVNQNLLSAITSAITGDSLILGAVASTLTAALNSALSITSNYQTNSGGVFSVSALHLTILSSLVSLDIARSTVGPNTVTVASTTTTTTVPSTTTTVPSTTTTVPTTTTTVPPNTVTVVWIRQVPGA